MHGHAESELTKRIDAAVIKGPLFTKAAPSQLTYHGLHEKIMTPAGNAGSLFQNINQRTYSDPVISGSQRLIAGMNEIIRSAISMQI